MAARAPKSLPRQAPGDLRILQDFANTLDHGSGRDLLRAPQELTAWLTPRMVLAMTAQDLYAKTVRAFSPEARETSR